MSPGFKDSLWKVAGGFIVGNAVAVGRWWGAAIGAFGCACLLLASVGTKIVDQRNG